MKGSEIHEGGVYAWRSGQYGNARRCLVLDVERVFQNRYVRFWPRDDNVVTRTRSRRSTGRLLVAIEVLSRVDEDGRVWDALGSAWRSFGDKRSVLPPGTTFTEWIAWAARSVELVSTWKVEAERQVREEQEEQARQRIRDEANRRQDERNAEMRALRDDESAWRKNWHETRDRRLEIETRTRTRDRIVELLGQYRPGREPWEIGARIGLAESILDEFVVDLREPLPDPLRSLFSP